MSVGTVRATPPTPTRFLDRVTSVDILAELGLADRSTA